MISGHKRTEAPPPDGTARGPDRGSTRGWRVRAVGRPIWATILLVVVASCSGTTNPSPPSPNGTTAPSTSASPVPSVAPGASPSTTPSPRPSLQAAVAANFQYAFDDLVAAWLKQHPEQPIKATYGSSGSFFAQISQGAPFDVFFSANVDYPKRLAEAGLGDASTLQTYAVGHLVLWVRNDSPLDVAGRGIAVLTDPTVQKIAIANPEHAPYGKAAMAALDALGYTDAVRSKLVLGEDVAQAAQFAESGNADVALIPLSLARAPTLVDKGRYALVPVDSYEPIHQAVIVIGASEHKEAARAFIAFVLGADGRAILDRYGYGAP